MQIRKVALALTAGLSRCSGRRAGPYQPSPRHVPAGAFATLDVRVPGEQEGAHVTKVDVLFPLGFVGVDYENVPGWSTHIIETKLATPITEDGETIDTEVSQIVWTWIGPLGKVGQRPVHQLPAVGRDTRRCGGQAARIPHGADLQQRPDRPLDRPFADRRTPCPEDQRDSQRRSRPGSGRRTRRAPKPVPQARARRPRPRLRRHTSGGSLRSGAGGARRRHLGLLFGILALLAVGG